MRLRFHQEIDVNLKSEEGNPFGLHKNGKCRCGLCRNLKSGYSFTGIESHRLAQLQTLSKRGIIILEINPQIRTFLTIGNKFYQRFPLPYLIVTICYEVHNGKYKYCGIKGCGLTLYFASKKLKSFQDHVAHVPWDRSHDGIICTPHEYDDKEFSDLPSLVNFVIGLWYATPHRINDWENQVDFNRRKLTKTIDWSFLKNHYNKQFTLFKCLNDPKGWIRPIEITDDAILINKPWPPKKSGINNAITFSS